MVNRAFQSLTTACRHIYTFPTASLTTHLHMYNYPTVSVQTQNIMSSNKLLASHVRSGRLQHAHKLFNEMPVRDVVSWNTMLLGLRKTKDPHGMYGCLLRMQRSGLSPNEYTVSTILSAVFGTEFNVLVSQLHTVVIRTALNSCLFVGSALMRGYADVGDPVALRRVFDEISEKDSSSWTALVSSYMKMGWLSEAERVFDAMPEKNIVAWTSLMNGYIDNKRINKARAVFDGIGEKNVVSWTAMINGYVQHRYFVDALELFVWMLRTGTRPNDFTFSSVLGACAGYCSLLMGQQVHSSILKSGVPDDIVMSSSLVDMYAKCGDVDAAYCVFDAMPNRNVVSWNSIIGGYARHGLATRALDEFERMRKSGIKLDEITFVNVLSACAHGGLIEQGMKHFSSMVEKYRIQPRAEHYACMVDLYGRAGNLEEAVNLIKGMPVKPDIVAWGALLAACGLHSSLEVGEFAAEGINKLKNEHFAVYSMLTKIHGEKGSWNIVIGLREMMKRKRVKKQNASSSVESHFALAPS